jgi:signal peptidase I
MKDEAARAAEKEPSRREPVRAVVRGGPKADTRGPRPSADETRWGRTKANLKTIGGAVALALFIRIVLFEAFEIEGPSMQPTLLNGDRVVVAKFFYGLFLPFTTEAVVTWGMPRPGEVVIVKSPADDIDIVKRVIGVPGDVIEIRDDVVYRNGRAIPHERQGPCRNGDEEQAECEVIEERLGDVVYLTSHNIASVPSNYGPVTIPPDHVYILGDHRDRSNDSRFFGAVPINRVKGRALAIYWSNEPASGIRWDRMFDGVH